MKPVIYLFLPCLMLPLLMSCGAGNNSDDPFNKCKYGKPQPVFEGSFAKVDSQKWEIKGMEGIEQVWFEDGMQLELLQQGCDKVKQTFNFKLPGTFAPDENWVLLAASQFQYLSAISERHFELGVWGQAIQQKNAELLLGERMSLQPGYSIKIDKVSGGNAAILIVELSED